MNQTKKDEKKKHNDKKTKSN